MLISLALALVLQTANASFSSCVENLKARLTLDLNHNQVEAFTKRRSGLSTLSAEARVAWIERILKTYTRDSASPTARWIYRHALDGRALGRLSNAEATLNALAKGLDAPTRERLIGEFLALRPVFEFETKDFTGRLSDRFIDALLGKDVRSVIEASLKSGRDYGQEEVYLDHRHRRFTLTMPYRDTWRLLRRLQLPANSKFVDIGAASGSIGTIIGLARPDIKFFGLELVSERVREAQRVAELLNLKNVHYEEHDLSDPKRLLPEADTYFIFNPTNAATTRIVAAQLNEIGRHRPTRLLVSKNSWEYLWLIEASKVFHRVGDPETTSVVSMLIFESR